MTKTNIDIGYPISNYSTIKLFVFSEKKEKVTCSSLYRFYSLRIHRFNCNFM